jgi:hypothetical protein
MSPGGFPEPDIPKCDCLEQAFELDSYAKDVYNFGMLANSQTAGCQVSTFAATSPWRQVNKALHERAVPGKHDTKDTVIAAAFLCAYMVFYLGVGFAGLSAVGWVWTYLTN